MKIVIMAGGRGTRIADLFPDIPKPMIPIQGPDGVSKPVLEWEIISLREQGFTDILLTVSHMHEKIEAYFGNGNHFGVKIDYIVEQTPLGNAGALIKYRDKLGADPFLVLIADAMFDVDFTRMVKYHKQNQRRHTLAPAPPARLAKNRGSGLFAVLDHPYQTP